MIAVVNYGVGNLFSLKSSLEHLGIEAEVTGDKPALRAADKIILPGVGAFHDAAALLARDGLDKCVIDCARGGVPVLGICLGMQLLFEESLEYGRYRGLGLIGGRVVPIREEGFTLKIPHIGWNSLKMVKPSPLLKYNRDGDYVYYVHSYFASDCDCVTATSYYGRELTGAVQYENIYGTQFHPEKSGETGLKMLKAFSEL